eukprot:gb/GECG01003540.1/.p1 GENE.gb/GECG01003540.1/~~gb/GECG01003540.1/.p1  ORF type:complete len:302 (+),score=51.69 gb/GECG01003540.1/:1-906(+)
MASRMRQVQEVKRLNQRELDRNFSLKESWHWTYKGCAWVYVGGLPYKLTEGDVICIFSQFGEIEDIHLVRNEETGKSMGFAFVKYEDWRSTILAVDNMNGVEILGRTINVDHKKEYKPPKPKKKGKTEQQQQEEMPVEHVAGHAYKDKELANEYDITKGVDVFGKADEDDEYSRDYEAIGKGAEHDQHATDESESKTKGSKKKKKHKRDKSRKRSSDKDKKHRDRVHDKSSEKRKRSRSQPSEGRYENSSNKLSRSGEGTQSKNSSKGQPSSSWRGRAEPSHSSPQGNGMPSWRGRREPRS